MDIDTNLITVNKRKRQIDPVKVAELAGSINEIGLLCPIVVRRVNEHFELVAGAHRMEAFKLLGRNTIPAEVFSGSDLDAELAEIDENLKRAELTVLEQGELLVRRNEILIERGERAQSGTNIKNLTGVMVTPVSSTSDIASEIGLSESSAHQRMQIAHDIAPDVKDAIRDTPIADSTTQLLALARMDEEAQRTVVERIGNSGKTVKQAIQDLRDESKRVQPFPTGKYQVIYADPPWQYDNSGFNESAENQYPTMTIDEICVLPIESLCTDESILFLWATNPLLEDALKVMRAWGFAYKTNMAWIKDKARGKGWFLKSKHELILIGTRKNTPHPAERLDSCFEANRGDVHSRKPECVYGMIEAMYPGKKVELFARQTRKGWTVWGNEQL